MAPVGTVIAFAGQRGPAGGWLKCNGAAVHRNTFKALYGVIAYTYGMGVNSWWFRLPDMRGEFLRGFDDGAFVDKGRVFGSWQRDAFGNHAHLVNTMHPALNYQSPYQVTGITPYWRRRGRLGNFSYGQKLTNYNGAIETRPRNIAMSFWIKF